MAVLYLVRHGQASFGSLDYDQLSDRGVEQGRVLGGALRGRVPPDVVVFSGSMRRHRETAEACLSTLGVEGPIRTRLSLDEFDHEEVLVRYEPRYADRAHIGMDLLKSGDPKRAFQDIFARAAARWASGAHDDEYRESWRAFRERTTGVIPSLVADMGSARAALVFTSGGPISAIAGALLGVRDDRSVELQFSLVNCGITKLVHGRRGTTLVSLNEHAHFEGNNGRLITYR